MAEKDLQKNLTELLRGFQTAAPGVIGASIVSMDGFTIAAELPTSVEEHCVAAMAAAMLALGEQTTAELEHGKMERVFIEGSAGYTIIISAGPEAVLSVVARRDAKLGFIFLQMERVAENIRAAM